MAESGPQSIDLGVPGLENAVQIGRGGFGVVYRAQQPDFGRTVAVKVLTPGALDEDARSRFRRELKAVGMLSGHPNIVTVHSAGFTAIGDPYLIMGYEEGGSLGDRLRSVGPLPWQEAVRIGVKISGALEAAHAAGVLHRDLKPENILISSFGEPKLADFGIARMQGGTATRTGMLIATIAHAAPELLAGEPPSVASDVYALGSTIYTLIRGRPAFAAEGDEGPLPMMMRIGSQPVPDLRSSGVPDAVCRVLERAMAKAPGHRQRIAVQFREQLAAALPGPVPVTTSTAVLDERQVFETNAIATTLGADSPPPVSEPPQRTEALAEDFSRSPQRAETDGHHLRYGPGWVIPVRLRRHARALAGIGVSMIAALALVLIAPWSHTPRSPAALPPSAAGPPGATMASEPIPSDVYRLWFAVGSLTDTSNQGRIAIGSGVVIAHDASKSYLITNSHILKGATRALQVVMHGGEFFQATLEGSDAADDLAVISVQDSTLEQAQFGRSSELQVGQQVVELGGQVGGSIARGPIAALHVRNDWIQSAVEVNVLNMGGPLADMAGHVVGINVASSGARSGFSIPSDVAQPIVQALILHQQIQPRASGA